MEEMSLIIELVQSVGLWAIFAWLYTREKTAHEETRKAYREDLREIAGIRQPLRTPPNWQASDVQLVTKWEHEYSYFLSETTC